MSRKVQWQRVVLVAVDALIVAIALYVAYMLRFDTLTLPRLDYHQYLAVVGVFVAVRVALFGCFHLYRGILRYASTSELTAIAVSATLGSCLLAAANILVIPFVPEREWLPEHDGHMQRVPWNVIVNEYVLTMMLVGAARFSRRIVLWAFGRVADAGDLRRVLIVGAGDAGEAVARQMRYSPMRTYQPVAFVDDNPHKQHRRIHGIPVAGTTDDIPAVIKQYDVQEVVIAIPRIAGGKLSDIVAHCDHARAGFKILPSISDVLDGRISINQIRPVEIEDLLGREENVLDLSGEKNYVRGHTIMVTGAGGSIGSELVRQLLPFGPRQIVVMGHGENSIYELATELGSETGAGLVRPVIGDIRDPVKLESVVRQFKPEVFFHAAAHKHVPLMEWHPDEAIKNNVTGTLNVARAADAIGALKFILISSDKAVRPTNVMGATKRVAEMIVFSLARTSRTQFVAVRFGNVLGSRGSVIPLFKRQIAHGGPVTLTHPDVTRYFMTIPEAVSLVIKAGSSDEQRRLYLLDMGSPVKIVDLARNLIRLSGFEPDEDIEVRFIGLRPGEKLIEELLTAGENVKTTEMGKIYMTEPDDVDPDLLWRCVGELEQLAAQIDTDGIRRKLGELVPDYQPSGQPA